MIDLEDLDESSLRLLYDSMRDSIIDVASMDSTGVTEMKKFLYEYGKTGDLLRVNVSIDSGSNPKTFVADAVFLEDGAEVPTLDTNMFLPFEGVPDAQDITIASSKFQFVNDKVVVDGEEIEFGSPFIVGGRRVVLAKGSVVLMLEDSLVRVFPEEGVQSEIIVNDGTLAVGDVMTTGIFQVEKKEESDSGSDPNPSTSLVSYVFFHDASTDQGTCVAKSTHTVDFLQTTASSLIDLGYVDGTLEKVLDFDTSSVSIRTVSTDGKESVATIDVDGLSFSSNDSAVILGSFSEFRMKYDETTDTIQIQHLDDVSGEYVTKREFGR